MVLDHAKRITARDHIGVRGHGDCSSKKINQFSLTVLSVSENRLAEMLVQRRCIIL